MSQLIAILSAALLVLTAVNLGARGAQRRRRAEAEARDQERLVKYFREIKPDGVSPAIVRDADGRVDVFRGLRRYAPTGKRRRGARVR